jgi:hypothetical protein
MVHIDAGKLGNIPDGGGWRTAGWVQGRKNTRATTFERSKRQTMDSWFRGR